MSLPVAAHLEFILLELQQVRVVGAEQEGAAAVVRVGVGDLPGAAAPAADWDAHLKGLQTHTGSKGQNVPQFRQYPSIFLMFRLCYFKEPMFCKFYLSVKDSRKQHI